MTGAATTPLYVCADDFGADVAACEAIIDLGRRRAISAASCLVMAPQFAGYARALAALGGAIALGLHFDLTEFSHRSRRSLVAWLLRAGLTRPDPAVLLELREQLDRFERVFGRHPDFIDGHQHVHQFRGVREFVVAETVRRYGRAVAVRSTVCVRHRGLKARLIGALGARALAQELRQHALVHNADFAGAYHFSNRVPFAGRVDRWIEALEPHGLLMCHPQMPPDGGRACHAREAEYAFLRGAAWPNILAAHRRKLVPFRAA